MYKLITAILVLAMACVSVQAESVENGSTSNSVYVVMETAAGVPTAGITVTELDLYFVEYQTAPSAKIDLAALAAGSSAYNAAGAAADCNNGLYRIDVPNTAFDGGIGTQVTIMVVDPNGTYRTAFLTVELSPAVDAVTVNGSTPISTTNISAAVWNAAISTYDTAATFGLTNQVAVESAADIKTAIEAGGSSIASILADTGELQTDWADGGRLDLILDTAAAGGGVTANDIWNAVMADHLTPGSTGAKLNTGGGGGGGRYNQ